MNWISSTFASAAIAFLVIGCGNKPSEVTESTSDTAGVTSPIAAQQDDTPKYPKNAQWTIRCRSIAGPAHVEQAIRLKEAVAAGTKSKLSDWHLLHLEEESLLLYGFYGEMDEKKRNREAQRAKKDLETLATIVDSRGNRPFAGSMLWPLSAPDPVSPPEWNLVNAPPDMVYTLEIGVYMDHPDRKKYAVDAVRAAREQGINAFYYHGPARSSVCVGMWPESAVRTVGADVGSDGTNTGDPDQPILVLPPGRETEKEVIGPDGRPLTVITPKMEIVDPTLKHAMKKFEFRETNGQTIARRGRNGKLAQERSVVMLIPRKERSLLDGEFR